VRCRCTNPFSQQLGSNINSLIIVVHFNRARGVPIGRVGCTSHVDALPACLDPPQPPNPAAPDPAQRPTAGQCTYLCAFSSSAHLRRGFADKRATMACRSSPPRLAAQALALLALAICLVSFTRDV
jgi:hypothetical protein